MAGETPLVVFDPEVVLRMVGDDLDLVREIVVAYLDQLPGMLTALEAAQVGGVAERVAFHAHSVKGVAANLGAARARQAAAELEAAARAADLGRCAALGPLLKDELAELTRELRRRYPAAANDGAGAG